MRIEVYMNPLAEFITAWEAESAPSAGDDILISGLVAGNPDTKVGFTIDKRCWNTSLGAAPTVQLFVNRWGTKLNEACIA